MFFHTSLYKLSDFNQYPNTYNSRATRKNRLKTRPPGSSLIAKFQQEQCEQGSHGSYRHILQGCHQECFSSVWVSRTLLPSYFIMPFHTVGHPGRNSPHWNRWFLNQLATSSKIWIFLKQLAPLVETRQSTPHISRMQSTQKGDGQLRN